MIEASPYVKAWRATVTAHTIGQMIHVERQGQARFPFTGPCTLIVTFHLERPKHHYRSGKNAHLLRDNAPRHMQTGPDLDKMIRAVGDALTLAGALIDDRQIALIRAAKKWTEDEPYTSIQLEGDTP